MTKAENNVVLAQLRAIRATLDDHTERFGRIEHRLSAVEQHLAVLVSATAFDRADLDSLRRRIERIEARLELSD